MSRRATTIEYEHGAKGWLDVQAVIDGTRYDHAGLYRYVGIVDGHLAFAPATAEPVIYLTASEVVSFRPSAGASG